MSVAQHRPIIDEAWNVEVNGRSYRWPRRPVVVICYDGCDPAYVEAACRDGIVPNLARMRADGFDGVALAAMPTFTNPNNVSIVCGAPPSVHGISGNYFLDVESGEAVMMLDDAGMIARTILSGFSRGGAEVATVTAKDKLLKALAKDLDGVAFSAEKADKATLAANGIEDATRLVGRPTPGQYQPDLSLFVLDAGVRLLEEHAPDLVYLSLSDLVQHSHAPGTPEANAFMAEVDARVGRLIALGATVGIVADHGMTDMALEDGSPNVVYLGDALDARFGVGRTRVICPITDPFVRHHGALGGFVRVHVLDPELEAGEVLAEVAATDGVDLALVRDEACARFELPADREADIVVVAEAGVAIGARAADHDLSQLAGTRLRSHGGLAEQRVPFILSRPLNAAYRARAEDTLRNFDIFDFAINGTD
ncbi:phosphonoacetate hydrolase [Amorphus sp. 3PC139-8]|uniref:phosphonoacetate hydrolase n=1 Tax=Amorphus sp. 3PC139-8 TaxID=2735676 RepID=UPI00345D68B7